MLDHYGDSATCPLKNEYRLLFLRHISKLNYASKIKEVEGTISEEPKILVHR